MILAAAAVQRARAAIGTEYRQSGCLEAVYAWCGKPPTGLAPGLFPSAIAAYRRTIGRVRTDYANAPAGAIHYWDGDPGHVALGTGGGKAITTNAPQRVSSTRNGVRYALVGERTIPEIGRGRGRYLGWALDAFNNPISTASPSGGGAKPIPEDDMFTDADRAMLQRIDNQSKWAGDYTRVDQGDGVSDGALAQLLRKVLATAESANQRAGWAADYVATGEEGKRHDGQLAALVRRGVAAAEKNGSAELVVTTDDLVAALSRPEVASVLANAVLDAAKTRL